MVKLLTTFATYFFPDFFFSVAGALDYLPELNELIERYFAIAIEVDRVKEFISWDLAESHLRPVTLCLRPIYRLVSILVKYLENTSH